MTVKSKSLPLQRAAGLWPAPSRAKALAPLAATLALAILWSSPASARAAAPQRYVMIVAYNHSQDAGVKPLRYADDDGVRYYELFRMSTDRVVLLSVLDEETARLFPEAARAARPPTSAAITSTLKRWNAAMEADTRAGRTSELVFIYAGHGDVDKSGEGYINLLRGKLRRRDLYQQVLAPSKASYIHLIIDACKSYFLVNRRGGKDWKDDSAPETHDAEIRAFLNRESLTSYPRVGVILATSGDQSTHEWERFRGGILSHGLRSALTGSADINGDGRVEYSELRAFLASSTAQVRHPEARLNVFARPPTTNRHQPLMDLRQARRARLLRFDVGLHGRYYLQDDRGIRYADMNKAAGTRFDVAVDRRRSYFIHKETSEAKVTAGNNRVQVSALSFGSSPLAIRGSLEQSFRKDLFRTAYSRGFYDGFCARTGLPPVAGGATEFVITRPEEPTKRRVHGLTLGYVASAALFNLDGFNHGLQLGYEYALHKNVTLGGTVEYARSAHENPAQEAFSLHRLAVMAGATARTNLFWRVDVRAELNLGYQGYFGSGPVWLDGINVGESSDTFGFRMEAGLGARLKITDLIFADLRGGLGVELVTLEQGGKSDERAHTAPYFALGLGVAL